MNTKALLSCAALGASLVSPGAWAITVFSDNGSLALVTETVTDFRSALGALNANGPTNFPSGRREINWDGVPDASADPNAFPGNFFNSGVGGRARGIEFSTPGTGFLVSANAANPTSTPTAFGFPTDFIPFSEQRMFAPVGSLITDVSFFNPAIPAQRATTKAFGAVFEDAEDRASKMSFFDLADNLLLTIDVPRGGSGELSFAGAVFESAVIGRVSILTGNAFLLANGLTGPGTDLVVMDDFIFGEPLPVPEPESYALMAAGLACLWVLGRRRKLVR